MQAVKWSVGTQMSVPRHITAATPRGIASLNSIGLMQTKRQGSRQIMTPAASALLGLRKHSLQAADKSTIVDSGAASPEIGMTYFIMFLTSHGKTLSPFIRAKTQFSRMLFRESIWKSRSSSANKISGVAAFIMDSCSCIMYRVKKRLVP